MFLASVVVFLLAADSSPAPPAPTVPAGTRVEAKLQSEVNTGRSKTGEAVVAVVTSPLLESRAVVVPRGSRLNGRVETIQPATHTEEGRVRLVFRDIQFPDGRHISTWITNSFEAPMPKRKLRYVLFMTVGGAAAGVAAGRTGRGAGAIGGALVGYVLAGIGDDSDRSELRLRSGKTLHLEFREDLIVPPQ
jgi:hypothetical protein